jgi:hypothetical protein
MLGISLNSVGISQAKGVELIAQREQFDATLPRNKATAQPSGQQPSRQEFAAKELTPEQRQQVAELQQIDRAVRAHEQAHLSAGRGVITSAANFSYTYGPDGKRYAVGGEVGIDTSAEKRPEANIDKGIRIQAAALAPMDPSPQDYRVASIGSQLEAQGRGDLARQQTEERAAEAERNAQARDEALRQTKESRTNAVSENPVRIDGASRGTETASRQRLSQAYSLNGATRSSLNVFA